MPGDRKSGITESRLKRKDGTPVDVETNSRILPDGRFVEIVRDITERKKAERKLADSENRLRTVIQTEPECVKLLGRQGELIEMNPAGLAMIEADNFEQVNGKSMLSLINEPYRKAFDALTKNVLKKGITGTLEFEITSLKGTHRWLETHATPMKDVEGKIVFLLGITRDITERKKAEEQLKTEKLFSDSLINSLPGIFYLYDNTGKFTRWNKNFETTSGYSAEEISGMHPFDFYDSDEKKLMQSKIENVFSLGSDDVTAHFYTKDKRKIPFYFNGHKISFNSKDYLIGVGIDITDRVRAEKELLAHTREIQELTVHLEQVREEERTAIAREIHDELGQQLTGLKMDASWISKRIKDEDKSIQVKLGGMLSLIDDTVKSVRRISTQLRPGILDDLGLVAALEWQCNEFKQRTGINVNFFTELSYVNKEGNLLINIFRVHQEALTNIARHAKATEIKTLLTIENGYLNLIITDNGIGFDMEEARRKKSWGLIGMKERALLFQGELTIESERLKGTVITLRIPLAEPTNPSS